MVSQGGAGGDTYVINVYLNGRAQRFVFQGDIAVDEVHHGLERGWGVGKSKEHHPWFEESIARFERGFFLVSLLNAYVVVPTMDIDFRVEEGTAE